jgi:hypothetical protein
LVDDRAVGGKLGFGGIDHLERLQSAEQAHTGAASTTERYDYYLAGKESWSIEDGIKNICHQVRRAYSLALSPAISSACSVGGNGTQGEMSAPMVAAMVSSCRTVKELRKCVTVINLRKRAAYFDFVCCEGVLQGITPNGRRENGFGHD